MGTLEEISNSELTKDFTTGKIDYQIYCKNYKTTDFSERHPLISFFLDDLKYLFS